MITIVALKSIAAEFGDIRSVPALSYALAWLGSAIGGLAMGPISERIGVRWTVGFGALMIAMGLLLSSTGGRMGLYVGHGVFMGLLGNAGINAPLYVYVSRWFDRRRGTALALIASGQALAGMIWAPLFAHAIQWYGWRRTMQLYAILLVITIVPTAFAVFRTLLRAAIVTASSMGRKATVLGVQPRTALGLLCAASFMCCVPMAMPQGHLVAFCSDVGIPVTHGSTMLSVLLACAFVGRQLWGAIADRVGGLRAILAGSLVRSQLWSGFC